MPEQEDLKVEAYGTFTPPPNPVPDTDSDGDDEDGEE